MLSWRHFTCQQLGQWRNVIFYFVRPVLFYLHAAIVFDRSKRIYQFRLHCTNSVTNGHLHDFFITTYVVWGKVTFSVVSVTLSRGSNPISSGQDLPSPCSPKAKTPSALSSHSAPSCPIASQGWSPHSPHLVLLHHGIYWQVVGWPSTERLSCYYTGTLTHIWQPYLFLV